MDSTHTPCFAISSPSSAAPLIDYPQGASSAPVRQQVESSTIKWPDVSPPPPGHGRNSAEIQLTGNGSSMTLSYCPAVFGSPLLFLSTACTGTYTGDQHAQTTGVQRAAERQLATCSNVCKTTQFSFSPHLSRSTPSPPCSLLHPPAPLR